MMTLLLKHRLFPRFAPSLRTRLGWRFGRYNIHLFWSLRARLLLVGGLRFAGYDRRVSLSLPVCWLSISIIILTGARVADPVTNGHVLLRMHAQPCRQHECHIARMRAGLSLRRRF